MDKRKRESEELERYFKEFLAEIDRSQDDSEDAVAEAMRVFHESYERRAKENNLKRAVA